MLIIIYLINLILLFYSLWLLINTLLLLKQKNIIKDTRLENKELIIVIPCLNEQKIILDTIKYFNKIFKNIKIAIITTKKENLPYEDSTYKIVYDYILSTKNNNIYLIEYPYKKGNMADQLNYFLLNIKKYIKLEQKHSDKDIYIALYNADSRPGINSLKDIISKINSGCDVIQQYSYAFLNYDQLNFILKGFAIYQSNFELKTGLLNCRFKKNILYKHVVGHGLIINLQTLKKINYFNTNFWCEDIYMTMQLKSLKININSVYSLEIMETPNKLKKLIKQNAVWFTTTKQYNRIYKDIFKKYGFSIDLFLACFNEFRCYINWMFFPILIFLNFIFLIINNNFIFFLLSMTNYLLYVFTNLVITIKIINKFDNKKYKINFKKFLYLFFAMSISNIGPLYSVIKRPKNKYKTER